MALTFLAYLTSTGENIELSLQYHHRFNCNLDEKKTSLSLRDCISSHNVTYVLISFKIYFKDVLILLERITEREKEGGRDRKRFLSADSFSKWLLRPELGQPEAGTQGLFWVSQKGSGSQEFGSSSDAFACHY